MLIKLMIVILIQSHLASEKLLGELFATPPSEFFLQDFHTGIAIAELKSKF